MKTLLISLFTLLFASNLINAQLSIDKNFILFDNKEKNTTIQVINSSNKDTYYVLEFIHQEVQEDGTYKPINKLQSKNNADSLIIMAPRAFIIASGASQTVRLQKKLMPDTTNGDYISFILIREIEDPEETSLNTEREPEVRNELSVKITPLFAVSFPIIVRRGEADYSLKVSKFKLEKKDEKNVLIVDVNRIGPSSARGSFNVMLGKKVIATVNNINIFSTINLRKVAIQINNLEEFKASLNNKRNNLSLVYTDSNGDKKFDFTMPITLS